MLVAPAPSMERTISLEGARILAGQLRDAVEARGRRVAEQAPLSRACPLDLHRLLPLPDRLLWLGPDALARIRDLLPSTAGEAAPLAHFVPHGGDRARTPLQRRAALASTFVVMLELGRDGMLAIEQSDALGEIGVRSVTRDAGHESAGSVSLCVAI